MAIDRDTLLGLSKDDLITLVLAQAAQVEVLTRRVADLETRLGQPPKTPDNSSLPPSRGAKPEVQVADRIAGQAGYDLQRQVCLAYLLRDAQFAIDADDEHFASNLHWLLLRAQVIVRCRGDPFVFLTRRDVPATNNACERALRPRVIFRKVTRSFRSQWGISLYAAVLSVTAPGRLHGYSALQAIQAALQGQSVLQPA